MNSKLNVFWERKEKSVVNVENEIMSLFQKHLGEKSCKKKKKKERK